MMMEMMVLLGVSNGMRTMTPIAVLCWFAWLGLLPQHGWGFWTGYLVSAIVFGVAALGEYFGDTLATTPSRTSLPQVAGRMVFSALTGALAANALGEPVAGGILFGVIGGLIGTYGGHALRVTLARRAGRDLPVALCETALALVLALGAVWKLHQDLVMEVVKHQS